MNSTSSFVVQSYNLDEAKVFLQIALPIHFVYSTIALVPDPSDFPLTLPYELNIKTSVGTTILYISVRLGGRQGPEGRAGAGARLSL